VDEQLFDDARCRCVGAPVEDGFDLAVGAFGFGEVLAFDGGDADGQFLAGEAANAKEHHDEDQDCGDPQPARILFVFTCVGHS
jgi:hypothetical protein